MLPHYRIRRVEVWAELAIHFVDEDGTERPLFTRQLIEPGDAPNAAALAILGDQLHGDWPRAWRLVDDFEREFLSGEFRERTIDAGAVAQWIERRTLG